MQTSGETAFTSNGGHSTGVVFLHYEPRREG
jgi:hypothetical protein